MPYYMTGSFVPQYCANLYPAIKVGDKYEIDKTNYRAISEENDWWVLDPNNTPKYAKLTKKLKNIPDSSNVLHGCICVNEKLKLLIEEFEPQIHRFYPIQLIDFNNNKIDGKHYLFDCNQWLNALVESKSNAHWTKWDENSVPRLSFGSFYNLYLDPEIIKNHHVWKSTRPLREDFFISNELHDAMKKAKIKGLEFERTRDIINGELVIYYPGKHK